MSSPLTLHHQKMRAEFGPGNVPLHYGNVEQEYWAVRKSTGLVDLSHLGRLTITGKDRISFLNGLLTNDLAKLVPGAGIHSALLNTKARVLADLYIYAQETALLVDTGDLPATRVKTILDQFIISEDVQLNNTSQDLLQISIQGPKGAETIRQILRFDVENLPPLSCKALGPSLLIVRDRTGLGGYDIIAPVDEMEAVWQGFLLKAADRVRPIGLETLEIFRLEKGFPKYGVDVDANVIVLEAGFRDAISFTKGCYMGQEVVARATHIGRVNKILVQMEIEAKEPPPPRTKLTKEGSEAGFVTSTAFSPARGKVVGLGYVQRNYAQEGIRLDTELAEASVPVIVTRPV